VDVSKLEPADRDPKKLRATAYKLIIFMVLSGIFLTFSYHKYQDRTSDSDRPSLLTKITEPDVELLTSDGKMRNLQDLKGKITLAITLPSIPQPESQASLDALEAIMEAFKDEPEKPTILVFVLDGTNTEPEKMALVLAQYGKEPEILRVAANADGKTSLRSFLKAKMRFNVTPIEKDGKFEYDTRLVLLDQFLHVRGHPGASHGWDFEKVARFDRDYAEALEANPNEEVKPSFYTTEKLRSMLIDAINYLYANPEEKGQK
jgi:hypothetical protein